MKFYIIMGIVCFLGFGVGPQALALVKQLPEENWQQEVTTIDQAIDRLTDLRNKELANAAWAQNQGDRLQFQSHNLLDARRYWNEADTSREIAARYQEEIDKLEVRKKEILENQGIPYTPSDTTYQK
ncbi:MAG: hypothetical protein KDK64_07360 [Chlamydiia bacterium]|nr:hypothetical protein [Chlamydiia bacterium]